MEDTTAVVFSALNKSTLKRKRAIIIIRITQFEADYLIKNVHERRLKKTSAGKRHGGRTYYVLNDDSTSLRTVAKLRGYTQVKKSVITENGKRMEIFVSPAQQLLDDN